MQESYKPFSCVRGFGAAFSSCRALHAVLAARPKRNPKILWQKPSAVPPAGGFCFARFLRWAGVCSTSRFGSFISFVRSYPSAVWPGVFGRPRPGAIWHAFGALFYGFCAAGSSAKVKKASKQRFWGWLQAKYQPFSSRARSAAKVCPAGISLW